MGVCDSNNKQLYNINYSSFSRIEHVQTIADPVKDSYKFNFSDKSNMVNRKFNLKFIFYNFKVKYCISHKPSRDSIYITEISIGEKIFPLILNQGQSPSIPNQEDIQNGYFHQKEYTLDELENTYLLINIYEYLDDTQPLINESLKFLPDEYKNKCNYNSFFRINLLSFLFKSQKCDFAMMGNNQKYQLSTKTRISFYCFIEHREKIVIRAKALKDPYIYNKIVCKSNGLNISAEKRREDDFFSIMTPPMTMNEFQKTDIFLETDGNYDNYQYISLNGLKARIINRLGMNLVNEENNFSNMKHYSPVGINNDEISINSQRRRYYKFGDQLQFNQLTYQSQDENEKAYLYLEYLPIIGQIPSLYFTEYGNIYSTAILNLINDDPELHGYRKNKQISCEDFYAKLNNYYIELTKPDFDFSILNEMHVLLMRSIDSERFMFIYPSYEHLYKMIDLFLTVGIKIIEKILKTDEDYKIIILTKLINILMRREELDNAVLCECMERFPEGNNFESKYNELTNYLYYLYEILLSNKYAINNDTALIELFSRLYYQKKYFRLLILSTLKEQEYKYNLPRPNNQNDIFIYDIINDERLNEHLINAKKGFKNFIKNEANLKRKSFDNYRLLKRIIAYINDSNLNKYPFDFCSFSDNEIIMELMEKDLELYKRDQINLSNDFYESVMLLSHSYFSINRINNKLIGVTNGHNQNAVYTLFVYFKSLFDYYYSATNCRLIMSYKVFEIATKLLADNEDSISLPRLFWFYYCCSHMMLSGNLKWFIVNIINRNFDKFALHWSFTIRQVFFKLAIFILYERLKNEEGKLFRRDKLNNYFNKSLINDKDPYIIQSNKDFALIEKEYNDWNERRKDNPDADYPMFFLPPPITNNGVID